MSATENDLFRLESVRLQNFRCFEDETFHFAPQFTLIVGDNGFGKTTVLDPLASAIGGVIWDWSKQPMARSLQDTDERLIARRTDGAVVAEPQYPMGVWPTAACLGQSVTWMFGHDPRPGPYSLPRVSPKFIGHVAELYGVAEEYFRAAWSGGTEPLPLLCYFAPERDLPAKPDGSTEVVGPFPRLAGYDKSLDPDRPFESVRKWFRSMEWIHFQKGEPVPAFVATKEAMASCLPDCVAVTYSVEHNDILVEMPDGALPLAQLSHGYRSMVAMLGDLAYHAWTLNPDFGRDVLTLTPGVVLIDEIDAHLHPKWQRRVVDDLRRVFPKVQFIATTHSPFIIQSMRPGEVIALPEPEPLDRHPAGIEDIAVRVMEAGDIQRSERQTLMMEEAEEFLRALRDPRLATSEQKRRLHRNLDRLLALYADDPAYCALLRAEGAALLAQEDAV